MAAQTWDVTLLETIVEPEPVVEYLLDRGSLPLLFGEKIRFNGFLFNDHTILERARVKSVDGLMDADLRDSRSESPDQDGEDFYDLLRGGRTLAFDGELVAGNLHSLSNLRQNMIAAISGRDELWFNRYDYIEQWAEAYTDNWTLHGSAATLTQDTAAGTMQTLGTGDVMFQRGDLPAVEDSQMVTYLNALYYGVVSSTTWVCHAHKVIKPGTVTYADSLVTPRGDVTADLIAAVFDIASRRFEIWRIQEGQALILAQSSVYSALPSSRPLYLVSKMRGNSIDFAVYSQADPRTGAAYIPQADLQATLTIAGANATKYGDGVYANTGLWIGANGGYHGIKIGKQTLEGLSPSSDASFLDVRRIGSIAGRESQDGYQYKRSFNFSLRSADAFKHSHAVRFETIRPTQVDTYGASYDWSYDVEFKASIDASGNPVSAGTVTVTNLGDADAYPEIVLVNGLTNATVTNLTTGQSFTMKGQVGDGESKSFNMRTNYALDNNGDDCSNLIDPASARIKLAPGDNVLLLTAEAYSSFGQCLIRYRDAWV